MQQAIHLSKEDNKKDALVFKKMLHTLFHLNKPTIAVIQGAVLGGAIGIVACADIVLAAPNTTFCFSEVKLGLSPAIICPYVIAAIGSHVTKRFMLTAEVFSANTALKLGLVHEVVPELELSKKLGFFMDALGRNEANALRITKNLINQLTEDPTLNTLQKEYTSELIAELRISKEAQEGLNAFLEKRLPQW